MSRDPLRDLDPHTPKRLPDSRPTCSQRGGGNFGCDQYVNCQFEAEKAAKKGPFEVVVEDHRGIEAGKGRRVVVSCFGFARQFFIRDKEREDFGAMKSGYRLCDDRAYAALETEEIAPAEYTPDGKLAKPAQFKNKYKPAKLKPYLEQGPFFWPAESAAPEGALEAIRKAQQPEPAAK